MKKKTKKHRHCWHCTDVRSLHDAGIVCCRCKEFKRGKEKY